MPRYLVQRTFPDGLRIPLTEEGAIACLGVVARNADLGVTWVHSYVSEDRTTSYCLYDAPDPEAIRKAAARNGLPVDVITQVSVLDPYFYR
jgi:predicted amidohydrolase YtcJ